MAGAFDDAPSRRMAWDADGTVGFNYTITNQTVNVEWTTGEKELANNEENTSAQAMNTVSLGAFAGMIFPEPREIDGFMIATRKASGAVNTISDFQSSADTTNGRDGTFNVEVASPTNQYPVYPTKYRDEITSQALSAKTCIGFVSDNNVSGGDLWNFHVYGVISPGETPDRLLFLDTENSDAEFTKVLDFGDVPRGQTTERTFKLINNSSSKSINTIQITAEDLYLEAGDWYEFGDGGGSFQATYDIGNLANGAEETIHLKQVIPDGETLGPQAGRIKVSHASVT